MSSKGSTGVRIWLDDNRPAPEGWTHVRNVEQAKVRLLYQPVEEMSLDFDLDNPPCPTCNFKCDHFGSEGCTKKCGCHADNGRENGLDLVRWMAYWAIWPKKKPVVHSVNAEHGEEMKRLIEEKFPG